MTDHIKAYKMTYLALAVLVLLSFFQGLFNFKEKYNFRGAITASSHQPSEGMDNRINFLKELEIPLVILL